MGYAHHVEAACGKEYGYKYRRKPEPTVYHEFRKFCTQVTSLVGYFTNAAAHCALVSAAIEQERDIGAESEYGDDRQHGSSREEKSLVAEGVRDI